MIRRTALEQIAPRLSSVGYQVLLDVVATARAAAPRGIVDWSAGDALGPTVRNSSSQSSCSP